MTNYVFDPVTGSGTSSSPYTWGTGQINFTTAADWAVENSLTIAAAPSTSNSVPGSGTSPSGGPGQDSVGIVAGQIGGADYLDYQFGESIGAYPHIASGNFPVDVILNTGSVDLANLLLASFSEDASTPQTPTLEVSGATLNIVDDIENRTTVTVPGLGSAVASGGGIIDIENASSVEVGGSVYGMIDFNFVGSAGDKLQLDEPSDTGSSFAGVITGTLGGGKIILPNVGYRVDGIVTTGSYDASSQSFVVSLGAPITVIFEGAVVSEGPITLTFAVAGLADAGNLRVAPDGDGIELVMCFAPGTAIRTPFGDRAVEDMREGDQVCLARADAALPVRWIGRRRIDCRRHPRPGQVWPVRIAAGAFGDAAPSRDLLLSPDHALFVDGVLIPVRYLIDGFSVMQEPRDTVTYYHVELERHEVILAEGLPVESYLDTDGRARFDNAAGAVRLRPAPPPDQDAAIRVWDAHGCAPLVVTGPVVAAVRERLRERSGVPAAA